MNPLIEISVGELIDKLTILEIKTEKIRDDAKRVNVLREYSALSAVFEREIPASEELSRLRDALKQVNADLWRVEDDIRACESEKSFGAEFIALARRVYLANDRRANLKRQINLLTRSGLIEEKSYTPY